MKMISPFKIRKMKTSDVNLQLDKSCTVETSPKAASAKILRFMLVAFMLGSAYVLSSCAVEMRTPRPGISIESHEGGGRHNRRHYKHDNGNHGNRQDRD